LKDLAKTFDRADRESAFMPMFSRNNYKTAGAYAWSPLSATDRLHTPQLNGPQRKSDSSYQDSGWISACAPDSLNDRAMRLT
jgi:hypothetical protein